MSGYRVRLSSQTRSGIAVAASTALVILVWLARYSIFAL